MKEINKEHDQLSGHLGIIAVPLNNIKSIQGNTIEYFNPELIYKLNCSQESISYSCPAIYSKAGTSIEHKISATINGRSNENDRLLEEMLRYQFVVILQNSDGNFTRIADQSKGLNFSFEYSTSHDPNGAFGYVLSFYGTTLDAQKIITIY